MDRGAWWATVWGCKESIMTEQQQLVVQQLVVQQLKRLCSQRRIPGTGSCSLKQSACHNERYCMLQPRHSTAKYINILK